MNKLDALETELSRNVGRMFTYTTSHALNIISALLIDELGHYSYQYYNLDHDKSFTAPCWLFSGPVSHDRGVIWLTPVRHVDKSNV